MPHSARSLPIYVAIGIAAPLAVLSTACSSSAGAAPKATTAQPHSVSAGIVDTASPSTEPSEQASSSVLPKDVERTARVFTTAYAEHDARDGRDSSYADAGARAARLAAGELASVLSQRRPSQDAAWATLRAEKAHQTVKVTSTAVPDGAPAVTASSALVRVGYTLTTTPKSGQARRDSEQLALRLEHTSEGWRVTALPWV